MGNINRNKPMLADNFLDLILVSTASIAGITGAYHLLDKLVETGNSVVDNSVPALATAVLTYGAARVVRFMYDRCFDYVALDQIKSTAGDRRTWGQMPDSW